MGTVCVLGAKVRFWWENLILAVTFACSTSFMVKVKVFMVSVGQSIVFAVKNDGLIAFYWFKYSFYNLKIVLFEILAMKHAV